MLWLHYFHHRLVLSACLEIQLDSYCNACILESASFTLQSWLYENFEYVLWNHCQVLILLLTKVLFFPWQILFQLHPLTISLEKTWLWHDALSLLFKWLWSVKKPFEHWHKNRVFELANYLVWFVFYQQTCNTDFIFQKTNQNARLDSLSDKLKKLGLQSQAVLGRANKVWLLNSFHQQIC